MEKHEHAQTTKLSYCVRWESIAINWMAYILAVILFEQFRTHQFPLWSKPLLDFTDVHPSETVVHIQFEDHGQGGDCLIDI